jgi:drug/metabolite transporter (DMT)-like permease
MKRGSVFKSYVSLHIAVLLFGFTAILGALIQITALELVWWRVLLTALSLAFIGRGIRSVLKMPRRDVLLFLGVGVIVALHWLCFYGSIKFANASIALVCMATTSFFTALIEPILLRSRFRARDIILSLLVVPGMVLVVQNVDVSMMKGVVVGLLSALLASLFASLNKKYIDKAHTYTITFLEMSGSWIFLSLLAPILISLDVFTFQWPSPTDWIYLLILALLCTTLAFILALNSLKHLSAFASNLVINLEPVYGILLAILILREHHDLSFGFYWGVVIILAVVIAYPFLSRKDQR